MSPRSSVLVIEDQIGDMVWLLDLIRSRGYEVDLATNEQEARSRLEEVSREADRYALVIIDVAVATRSLEALIDLDDETFFESSLNTGIRLGEYARDLKILERLPTACLTVRDDEEVQGAMRRLHIPLFNKAPQTPSESIRGFLDRHLPARQADVSPSGTEAQ